jgi:hypothetical protein
MTQDRDIQTLSIHVGFEIFTTVTMKNAVSVYYKPTFRRDELPPSSGYRHGATSQKTAFFKIDT